MSQGTTQEQRITEGIDDAFSLFHEILEDPAILDRIPQNARIFVVANRAEEHSAERAAAARARAIDSFDVGDVTVYVIGISGDENESC